MEEKNKEFKMPYEAETRCDLCQTNVEFSQLTLIENSVDGKGKKRGLPITYKVKDYNGKTNSLEMDVAHACQKCLSNKPKGWKAVDYSKKRIKLSSKI